MSDHSQIIGNFSLPFSKKNQGFEPNEKEKGLPYKATKQFLLEQDSKERYYQSLLSQNIKIMTENVLNENFSQTEEGVNMAVELLTFL